MLSGNALAALGVETVIGRNLTPADDVGPAATPVAMIGETYWVDRFGRSVDVLGKTIQLNGTPVTIVGVVNEKFSGLTLGQPAKFFVPLTLQPLLMPRAQKIGDGGASLLGNPRSWWVLVMVRLRNKVSEARTQSADGAGGFGAVAGVRKSGEPAVGTRCRAATRTQYSTCARSGPQRYCSSTLDGKYFAGGVGRDCRFGLCVRSKDAKSKSMPSVIASWNKPANSAKKLLDCDRIQCRKTSLSR